MRDEQIDSAIDDVARAMTAGEPDAYLRARVLTRIAQPAPLVRPRIAWAAMAAAAAIVLAVLVFRGGRVEQTVPQVEIARVNPPIAPVRPMANTTNEPLVLLKADATNAAAKTASAAESASEVRALAPPALDVESIAIAQLSDPESIRLEHQQPIAPITLTPLGVDEQGERP